MGAVVARLLGLHPFLGLVVGSITLVDGHGTGAAYVERFGEATNIPGINEACHDLAHAWACDWRRR
jgi:glutamate:Na+ symporter, ESS family